jgi:hypothetical protein
MAGSSSSVLWIIITRPPADLSKTPHLMVRVASKQLALLSNIIPGPFKEMDEYRGFGRRCSQQTEYEGR